MANSPPRSVVTRRSQPFTDSGPFLPIDTSFQRLRYDQTEPFPVASPAMDVLRLGAKRRSGHVQPHSASEGMESNQSDGEAIDMGSDDESIDPETGHILKRKKGHRFYCVDFPPCNLSFTRSEHLARHIR